MEFGLEQIRPGMRAVVTAVPDQDGTLRRFGMVPGAKIYCRASSPGGHLVALELLGAVIGVRRDDLLGITVRRCP